MTRIPMLTIATLALTVALLPNSTIAAGGISTGNGHSATLARIMHQM
jgi:hypothetical protein